MHIRASTYAPFTHAPKFVHATIRVVDELPAGQAQVPVAGFGYKHALVAHTTPYPPLLAEGFFHTPDWQSPTYHM